MNVSCTIQTAEGDSFTLSPNEAAAAVLKALGGKTKSDMCTVTVVAAPQIGGVGTTPALTEPLVPAEEG